MEICHYRRPDDRYSYLTQSQSTIMEMMGSYRLWSQADQHKEKWARPDWARPDWVRPDWARPDWARPDCIFMVVQNSTNVCIGIVLHCRSWPIMLVCL